jgi:hypothetical protein
VNVELFSKAFNANTYNCSHFAVDFYKKELENEELADDLACFLLPEKERFADPKIKKQFKLVKDELKKGDIVVLHSSKITTHVAVCIDFENFIHLTTDGVSVVSWKRLHIGFKRSKVYRHVKYC